MMNRTSMTLAALGFLVSSASALTSPSSTFRCEQTEVDPYGFRQRIFIETTAAGELLALRDRVFYGDAFNDGSQGFEGNYSFGFDPPLASTTADEPRFSYLKVFHEEGGAPDTRVQVELHFRRGFAGRGSLVATFNDGLGGVESIDVVCSPAR